MKLWEALKFSNERKAEHAVMDSNFPLIATDGGVERTAPRGGSSCVVDCVLETWANMEPKARKLLMNSEGWEPVNPKPPLIIIAEAANHWDCEDHERLASERG